MWNRRKTQTKIQMKEIVKFIKEGLKITSKTKVNKHNYHPKTKKELKNLINQLIEERGNEGDFNDIDTSKITHMTDLFYNMNKFNGDISNWDVSNVTDMCSMFDGCKSFNQDISNWDVSNVINMGEMFYKCESFNQDISKWDVSNVKDFTGIFLYCKIEEKYKPKFK